MEASFSLKATGFNDYGLDERILQGIKSLKFKKPTAVQAACIPLALKGKDLLARANTGTGKTAAYSLPIIQKILKDKKTLGVPYIRALILVPTRDLCAQVSDMMKGFTKFLKKDISCFSIVSEQSVAERLPILKSKPDIIVTTPTALFQHLASRTIDLSQLQTFVIDEADLVIAESNQVASIRTYIPFTCQTFMMSATLTEDVLDLKGKIMNSPFVIKLQETEDEPFKIAQYYLQCREKDKYLAILGLLTTGELDSKSIIFVNKVDLAVKLHIFLDMFKIPAGLLNSEVPENSRNHIVRQFNDGVFSCLIATDESLKLDDVARRKAQLAAGTEGDVDMEDGAGSKKRKRSRSTSSAPAVKKQRLADKVNSIHEAMQQAGEYGVHRGIDFKEVKWVVNFDMCEDASTYTHRIGRTGRADQTGNAISFFVLNKDEDLLEYIQQDQAAKGNEVKPYPKPVGYWEKLRVRSEDVLDVITPSAVKQARVKELAREIVNSDKLKSHFKENPNDLRALNHLATVKPKGLPHASKYLHHLPNYMGLTRKGAEEAAPNPVDEAPSKRRNRVAQNKWVDPLQSGTFDHARRVEKRLTQMDLRVLDPAALRRRDQDRKKSIRKKKFLKKSGKK